ncbi:MAG: hypothetical protein JXA51_07720 [Dehalococcoidales bacterium]|nr:hypothetical protein [Dehalococcoidales bacterium]
MAVISSVKSANKGAFRWIYVVLPVSFFIVAVILTAVFYAMLPDEVAYRFSGGEPTHVAGRGGVIAWIIGLQFVFALISFAITYIVTGASRRLEVEETELSRTLFTVMGNLMALPQIILLFAMLDIFLYNAYQIKLIPIWVFAVVVLALGGFALGFYFVRAIRQTRRQQTNSLGE